MKIIFELSEEEQSWWDQTIKDFRADIIKPPTEYLEKYIQYNKIKLSLLKKDVSSFIYDLRSALWEIYIKDEIRFHQEVISHLVKSRELPGKILQEVINLKILSSDEGPLEKENIYESLSAVIGDYAGRIMPYFYVLSLSTTNSRRSRAGKTFEAIIKYIIKVYGYPFEDQASLGSDFYKKNNLGKMVDGVLPGKKEYESKRDKCLVITMKTTLRERWQEVVEELRRTNIPHIYLLTLDWDLTGDTLKTMTSYNITIVDYDEVKEKFRTQKNIISFNELFNREIPHMLSYWRK